MAKLVQKSGYIKSGKASGYMRYIATREGVEKLVEFMKDFEARNL